MQKLFITNRKNQKICVLIEENKEAKGLVFIMHGLGAFKEQSQVQSMTQAFLEKSYTVARFDTTNSVGESDGDYADATTTNFIEDLEDVIQWAKNQKWYIEPFVLTGSSLGALTVGLYAQNFPEKIKAVIMQSPVISGKLSRENDYHKRIDKEWQRTGWLITESRSKPGLIKKLKWSHMEDRLKYDLLPQVHKLTMSVILIVGENDESCPPAHQQILYKALPGPKEIRIIPGAPHLFREEKHLKELTEILSNWINTII